MKLLIGAALTALLALSATTAIAQSFPAKPVKIIVPSTPGDGSDILARSIAQKLTERWGQSVIVENRPGAGGVVGTEASEKITCGRLYGDHGQRRVARNQSGALSETLLRRGS